LQSKSTFLPQTSIQNIVKYSISEWKKHLPEKVLQIKEKRKLSSKFLKHSFQNIFQIQQ